MAKAKSLFELFVGLFERKVAFWLRRQLRRGEWKAGFELEGKKVREIRAGARGGMAHSRHSLLPISNLARRNRRANDQSSHDIPFSTYSPGPTRVLYLLLAGIGTI